MEGIPLFGEGGRSGVGPSQQRPPLPDLNSRPLPLPEPALGDEEESRKGRELMASEEYKEVERHAEICEGIRARIYERAEEVARSAGVTDPARLQNILSSVKFLTEEVAEKPAEERLLFLQSFLEKIDNQETWASIDKECKKWGGRGIC